MKATCAQCETEYNFDDSSIPEEGLHYRCPRCGNTVVFERSLTDEFNEMPEPVLDESGTNPIVNGVYAGALGGTGCAIPFVAMTLLGVGFMSLGLEISGFTAAAAMLLSFLRMLSLGVLIGISIAAVSAKWEVDMWSFQGGFIGLAIGLLIGIVHGIFVNAMIGGVFGTIAIGLSFLGWIIKALLVTVVVILTKNHAFTSYDEGTLSSDLSGFQKAAVGTLLFLMIFTIGMEVKGLLNAQSGYKEVMHGTSSEGLSITNLEAFYNESGDLIIAGSVENTSEETKAGWYAVAELLDEAGVVVRTARVINGVQSFTVDDMKILGDRGQQVRPEEFMNPEKDFIIEPGDAAPLRVVIYDPPEDFVNYQITLKDFDLNSMQEVLKDTFDDLKDLKEMQDKGRTKELQI